MGALNEIGTLLVNTFFGLYLLAVLLRLLLQITRADFYNPISQSIVKVTNPILTPLRRLIPSVAGVDTASIVLAIIVQMVATALLLMLASAPIINPVWLFVWAILGCIGMVVNIYFFAILISIILGWVAPGSYNPAILLLHQLTEPVLGPFRRMLPSLGGLDISPIFVFLVINIIQILLRNLSSLVGLYPPVVIGV